MKAFKCDRCGDYYDDQREGEDVFVLARMDEELDLCPRCYAKLNGFFQDGQKEAKVARP